jgi:hypothetical protein
VAFGTCTDRATFNLWESKKRNLFGLTLREKERVNPVMWTILLMNYVVKGRKELDWSQRVFFFFFLWYWGLNQGFAMLGKH